METIIEERQPEIEAYLKLLYGEKGVVNIMNKTNLRLTNELNNIKKNINKLQTGMQIKYKQLTEMLEIEYVAGRNKAQQLKRLSEYITLEQMEKATYKITSIKTPEKNRALKKSKSQISDDMYNVIMIELANKMFNDNISGVQVSKLKAIEMVGLVNDNYRMGLTDKKSVINATGSNTYEVNSFYDYTKDKSIGKFESACKRMANEGLILFKEVTYIITDQKVVTYDAFGNPCITKVNQKMHIATIEQEEVLMKYERIALKELGFSSKYECSINNMYGQFRNKVCNKLGIKNYFGGYYIKINNDKDYGLLTEVEERVKQGKLNINITNCKSFYNSKAKKMQFKSKNTMVDLLIDINCKEKLEKNDKKQVDTSRKQILDIIDMNDNIPF